MSAQETQIRSDQDETLLSVDNLSVEFAVSDGRIQALRDVSLSIESGETLGIAGESGSGKSTLAYAIVRYLDNNAHVPEGSIEFKGRDLLEMLPAELRSVRGKQIAHVAQNASRALNPSMRIGKQIRETIELHQDVSGEEAQNRVHEVLDQVNIPDPWRSRNGTRTNCPAASNSGRSSRRGWPVTPTCSSSTSRRPGWTSRRRRNCSTSSRN
ncbi:ATP-binding cassette domain-containing protein [Haloarculaceae archaeon H-GB2-1]|nr:ATP-binding cassette domain-containing protein [Haloarculaceae archaeon H-GB11]MEA5409382.1 ATP-binding cassette domain-containing protein [Haloarculaceae archaeon H-GB2-1]